MILIGGPPGEALFRLTPQMGAQCANGLFVESELPATLIRLGFPEYEPASIRSGPTD